MGSVAGIVSGIRYQELSDFMCERHSIYLRKKEGKPWPWTNDPILRHYRFCNVFRELDTVTVWIRDHIREPFAEHKDLLTMIAIARLLNWPDTLQELIELGGFPNTPGWEPAHATAILDARQARGKKIHTGAYMIKAETCPKVPWFSWSKNRYLMEIVIQRLYHAQAGLLREFRSHPHVTQKGLFDLICWNKFLRGWGPFMTYEVITDLTWTPILAGAIDRMTWANPGLGAKRGLNRVFNRPVRRAVPDDQAVKEMNYLLVTFIHGRPGNREAYWPKSFPSLTMREIEHSLCEFDKYERTRLGEGKPRNKYSPPRG